MLSYCANSARVLQGRGDADGRRIIHSLLLRYWVYFVPNNHDNFMCILWCWLVLPLTQRNEHDPSGAVRGNHTGPTWAWKPRRTVLVGSASGSSRERSCATGSQRHRYAAAEPTAGVGRTDVINLLQRSQEQCSVMYELDEPDTMSVGLQPHELFGNSYSSQRRLSSPLEPTSHDFRLSAIFYSADYFTYYHYHYHHYYRDQWLTLASVSVQTFHPYLYH